ncbi:hypothetical protein DBZ36_17590 [Alginatibacterium sediminis]|uniref:Uncharacterized protein n=1 Tax=Alginatibacterium sediminis TaxID=2164068 RepID=A0A420E7T0_9ALTE|nr:hypothetical protein [Alginatibacterium sediminis]RKF14465.1 hypothetical protein DBZ36_17590 [Alginatibacterium sediminis]
MNLSKPFYELLPWIYFALGSLGICFGQSWLWAGFAGILYSLGALIWIMRSNYRRKDPILPRSQFLIPEFIYEFIPFVWVFLSLCAAALSQQSIAYVFAAPIIGYGCWLLTKRYQNRHGSQHADLDIHLLKH